MIGQQINTNEELVGQLALSGRMVVLVRNSIMIVNMNKDDVEVIEKPGFSFVPLVGN